MVLQLATFSVQHTHRHSLLDFINTFFQMHLDRLKSPFFFYFIILSIYVDPSLTTTHYNESKYESCVSNSSNCGKSNLTISYPFWRNGSPEYCGHFGFNLSCVGDNFKINMKSYTYNVIDIDYSTSTLKIVSEQFSRGDPCPGPKDLLHNTTLDRALFNYTSNVYNASLYYDCRPETDYLKGEPYSFSCEQSHLQQLSFLLITESWNPTLQQICGVQLNVPVFEQAFKDLFNLSSLSSSLLSSSPSPPPAAVVGNLLSRGFAVKWVIDQGQCQECYISGGNYCAYNQTLNQSTCMCKDGVYPKVCPQPITPSRGLSLKAKVGIGVAVACGVLLIMLTLFVFKRERKHYHSSTLAPSQKTSQLCSTSVEEKSSYFGAQLFSYNELQQATNNFEASKELGKGGFGIVYYGKLQDGRDVAIKRLYENHNKQVEQFMNEVEILTQLEHKNLVKLYGCSSRRSPNLLLVYEYIPNGTLAEHLHGKQAYERSLPWATRLRISIETATALVYLHGSDIIHRDVKTKNILLDTNYSVKVADFGLSRLFPMDMSHISTTPQGSPGYVDPEYHQFYQLTNKSDVYSFGVVLAELVSAKPAVDITRNRQEINLSSLAVNKIGERAWAEFVDPNLRFEEQNSIMREQLISVAELTYQCLEATSHARPCMEQVLQILKRIQAEEFVDASTIEGGSTLEESNSNSLKSVIVNVSSGTLESY